MKHLKLLLRQPLNKVSNKSAMAILVIALLGFADAAFLTIEHFRGVVPPCTTAGCDLVLTSQYSVIFGIPASLLGALYYLAILLTVFIFLESRHASGQAKPVQFKILKWAMVATVLGLLMSIYFVVLQMFVIHAYCLYCMGSALTSTLLFVFSMRALNKNAVENNIYSQQTNENI
jgi:uncharacterized membrane protein